MLIVIEEEDITDVVTIQKENSEITQANARKVRAHIALTTTRGVRVGLNLNFRTNSWRT